MAGLSDKQKLVAVCLSAGLVAGVLIGRSMPWYESYEECVLRESKGVPAGAMQYVRKFCREKFPPSYERPAAEAPAAEAAPAPEAAPAADAMAPN